MEAYWATKALSFCAGEAVRKPRLRRWLFGSRCSISVCARLIARHKCKGGKGVTSVAYSKGAKCWQRQVSA